ncbi:MAG: hypothetical protein KFB93_01280 [Simkaniaceae bacterium]|jgi:ribosomal protein RSM22 (predicted rRNA methylase)|nr:MAG: hypothetical protein KFB93_01280 [Simkaniaceae bacterium]
MSPELEERIEVLCSPYTHKELLKASEDLTFRYHDKKSHDTELHRVAYLATRMPATYAVLSKVLSEVPLPQTILDCGAGPGTSAWALLDASITSLTLIEKDLDFVKLGQKLAPTTPFNITWKTQSFLAFKERAELVLFSYSLNEIPQEKLTEVIAHAHNQTENLLVIIEPGTPEGFERIRQIRAQLLSLGMSLHAPCPHHNECPMSGSDWCHFSARLSRTSLHRTLKKGSLGHEDEKYSYLIASKAQHTPRGARILRHPIKKKGHTIATLCTSEGVVQKTFTGKERKKLKWGDWVID